MKSNKSLKIIGSVLLAVWLAVWYWEHPDFFKGPLSAEEIEHYIAAADKLPMEEVNRPQVRKNLRAFMEQDDGKPFYMLNLMRFWPELNMLPGFPDFKGTPQEANAYYEKESLPSVFRVGGYPVFFANHHGGNITVNSPNLDNWSRTLVVYYPSRRAFMEHINYEPFQKIEAYKFMALDVVLAPTEAELNLPSPTLLIGALFLLIFLALGWWFSRRRH